MQSKDTEGNSFVAVVVDDEVTFYTRNKKQLQRGCATTDLRRTCIVATPGPENAHILLRSAGCFGEFFHSVLKHAVPTGFPASAP